MPEKKDSYQPAGQSGGNGGGHGLPSQESIDLLTRLLQEFERRSRPAGSGVPPEVERDIAIVNAAFASLDRAVSLGESPVDISGVLPDRGPAAGGTRVRISGVHLHPGATVTFGNIPARDVAVVSPTEIVATTPPGPAAKAGQVDVVVTTLGGSARLACGYTYQA